jgi:hypothetical protein|tara:strand:- start:350 stop:559 length:210 start_codon:yes stop_codon:yes gene_type:complete
MDPSRIPELKHFIAPFEDELRPAFHHLQTLEFPAHLASFQKQPMLVLTIACGPATDLQAHMMTPGMLEV